MEGLCRDGEEKEKWGKYGQRSLCRFKVTERSCREKGEGDKREVKGRA